jgi:transposase
MKEILTMTQKEIERLLIIQELEKKKLGTAEAAEQLEISIRELYRIIKRYRDEGAKGVIHKLRGKKSNRGYPEKLKQKVVEIYKNHFPDGKKKLIKGFITT